MSCPIVGPDADGIQRAVGVLRGGGLVISPTVTNYNLVGDATNASTVRRIFQAKRRTKLGPLPVSLPQPEEIPRYVHVPQNFPVEAFDALLPGEVSFIFQQRYPFPDQLTCGLGTVAVSVTSDEVFRSLVVGAARPIAATSANLSGRGNLHVGLEQALADLRDSVDLVVDAGPTVAGRQPEHPHRANTIVDFTFDQPYLCRPGWVATDLLREWFPRLVEDPERYQRCLRRRAERRGVGQRAGC